MPTHFHTCFFVAFVRLFGCAFVISFARSLANSFVPPFARSIVRSFARSSVRCCVCLFVRSSFSQSNVRSFVHRIALSRCHLIFVVVVSSTLGSFSLLALVLSFFWFVCTSLIWSTSLPLINVNPSFRVEILTSRSPYMRNKMKEGVSRQGSHGKCHQEGHDLLVNRMTHQRNDSDRKK